jgi:hypothetical protein
MHYRRTAQACPALVEQIPASVEGDTERPPIPRAARMTSRKLTRNDLGRSSTTQLSTPASGRTEVLR